jgi:hypothetical protein
VHIAFIVSAGSKLTQQRVSQPFFVFFLYLMMEVDSNFQNIVILYVDDGQSPEEQFNIMLTHHYQKP